MDYELKYLLEVQSFAVRIQVVNNLLEKDMVNDAIKAVRALIEASGIVVLKKIYNIDLDNTHISFISSAMEENGDEELAIYLKDIGATFDLIYEKDTIVKDDVLNILLKFDNFFGKIIRKYNGIFD